MLIQDDIYEYIIGFVDEEDIMNMLSVNKKFYDEKILIRIMAKRFPFLKNFKKDERWRPFYKKMIFAIIQLKEIGIFYISHPKFNPYKIFSKQKYDYNKFLKYSIEIGKKNWVFKKDINPTYGLKYSIQARNQEMIYYFLEKGNFDFVFPEVMETGDRDLIEFFLNEGVTNFNGGLLGAVKSGNIEMVRLMIIKGANNFEKVIFYSLKNNFHDITNLLLEKNIKEFDKALLGAVEGGNLEMVKILINKGSSNLIRSMKSALKYKHANIIKFLLTKINDFASILNSVIKNGNLELAKNILDKRVNITVDSLICAAKHGRLEILKLLIEKRGTKSNEIFNVNCIACQFGRLDIVRFLYEESQYEYIPVYVCTAASRGHFSIIKYFENKGFNDYERLLSCSHLEFDVIKYALEKGAKNFEKVLEQSSSNRRNLLFSIKKYFLTKNESI